MSRKKMNSKSILLVGAAAFTFLLLAAQAEQAYAGGYYGGFINDADTMDAASYVSMYTEFDGTTTPSKAVLSIMSSAGIDTNKVRTSYLFQQFAELRTTKDIYEQAEVHYKGTNPFDCGDHGGCEKLGTTSTIDKIFLKMVWSGSYNYVYYYFNVYYTDGTSKTVLDTYTKPTGDTTKYFAVGKSKITGDTDNVVYKWTQFGAELTSTSSTSSGWKIRQYDGAFYKIGSGAKYMKDFPAYTTKHGSDGTHSSIITNYINSSGTKIYNAVGTATTAVQADYPLKSGSTQPDGSVLWYGSTSTLAVPTQLWN